VVTNGSPVRPRARYATAWALVSAAVVVVAYVGLAALSGHLSPVSRGPLLDGTGPAQPYRWVNPPPALTAANKPPSSLVGSVPLTPQGSLTTSFITSDGQVTVIVAKGSIPAHGKDISAKISVTPVDPATLGELGGGLKPFGNAYRIAATYLPSKTPVGSLARPIDVVLLYPATAELHASQHTLLSSPTGQGWTALDSKDIALQQQVEANTPTLGYVVVGGVPSPVPITVSPGTSTGGRTTTIVVGLVVAAACLLLVGLGLMLRGRSRAPASGSKRRK
jgi:hypothetical protein